MRIVFTELFDNERKRLNITRKTSVDILNNPDKREEIKYDDLVLRLFLKKESRNSYLIILARFIDDELHLCLPFRILVDLFPNIEILEPLMILQLLAEKHGLVLRIGSRMGRFIYKEDVQLPKIEGRLVEVMNPNNRPFLCSVFVKRVESGGVLVARCALAFCIDRMKYTTWISSEPKFELTHKMPLIMPVTRIIPLGVARAIQKAAIKEKDRKKRFNLVELGLSLQIIRRIMGNDWYLKVLRRFKPGEKITNKEYGRLVKSNNVHPLSEALWNGKPEKYIRLINLAHFLNQLWRQDDSNHLSEKIKELRRYSFIHAYYELKMAAYFDRREFPVTFIKRIKGLKTPDFQIYSPDGFAYAECKLKDSPSLDIDGLFWKAALQIENYGGPGIIFIEIIPTLNKELARELLKKASELLIDTRKVSLLILTSEELKEEFETVALSTVAWGIPNKNAHFELPEMIKKAALFKDPVAWFPLSQSLPIQSR